MKATLIATLALSFAVVACGNSDSAQTADTAVDDIGSDAEASDLGRDVEPDLPVADVSSDVEQSDLGRDVEPDLPVADVSSDAEQSDLGRDAEPDLPVADVGEDTFAPEPDKTTLVLESGEVVSGELVATFDHSLWWASSDQLTYALFEPDAFFPYPDDHSFRFVSSVDVSTLFPAVQEPQRPYQMLMRQRGLLMGQPPLAGISYVINAWETYHLEEDGFGDFAWDFVITDATGTRYFEGDGSSNEHHYIWDAPVFLPTGGEVIDVVRDVVDNDPGPYPPDAQENLVGIALGGSFYLYLLHFRQNTIPSPDDGSCQPALADVPCVTVGAVLEEGAYLGRVGNSGTTLEPHLHMTLLWYDADAEPPRSWSVPAEFADLFVTSTADPAVYHDYVAPPTGAWISADPF